MSGADRDEPSLREQAEEIEIEVLGRRALLDRVVGGKVRRPPEWIERMRQRIRVLEAAMQTVQAAAAAQDQ